MPFGSKERELAFVNLSILEKKYRSKAEKGYLLKDYLFDMARGIIPYYDIFALMNGNYISIYE